MREFQRFCLLVVLVLVVAGQPWSNPLPRFASATSPWNVDVSNAALDPNSAQIIQFLVTSGGFGSLNIDTSFVALYVNCSSPRIPFTRRNDYYPDCETPPATIPIPAVGAIEGNADWTSSQGCVTSRGEDCHLTVFDVSSNLVYEGYRCEPTAISGGVPTGMTCTCLIVWDLNHNYPANQRGDGCTSCDAAGFPMMPMLFTPEEAATPDGLTHAVRFILPNNRMKLSTYRHPASHCGGPTNTSVFAMEYGTRIRLRGNFSETGLSPGMTTFVRGLKKYGAFLSDGGNLPFTFASDAFRVTKWSDSSVNIPAPFRYPFRAVDFEVLPSSDNSATFTACYDCVLNGFFPSIPSCSPGVTTTSAALATTTRTSTSTLTTLTSSTRTTTTVGPSASTVPATGTTSTISSTSSRTTVPATTRTTAAASQTTAAIQTTVAGATVSTAAPAATTRPSTTRPAISSVLLMSWIPILLLACV